MAQRCMGGIGGRRRDLVKERLWREHVSAWHSSGVGIRSYCQEHGLSASLFHWWRGELKRRDTETGMIREGGGKTRARGSVAEVRLMGEAPEREAGASLEVVLGNGRSIRVWDGFNAGTLAQLVSALECGPC